MCAVSGGQSTNLVGWVNPCMNRLVPATMINKRALAAAVDSMQARNTSDWSKGIEFAYRAFIDVSGPPALVLTLH